MIPGAVILLLWTIAMLAVHLRSRQLVKRMWEPGQNRLAWLTVNSLVRFEGLYYIAAVIYAVMERRAALFVPIAVLAVIHFAVWAAVERRSDWPAATSEWLATFCPGRSRWSLGVRASIPGRVRPLALRTPPSCRQRKQLLDRIQIFDWGESLVLVYIAWWLVEALH